MKLEDQKCEACRRDSPRVTNEEAYKLHKSLENWDLIEDSGIEKLIKVFSFNGFMNAMKFAEQIAYISEEEGHHPALLTEWGSVRVAWWTHKIRGLHRNDFVMAAKTDELFPVKG